MVGVAQLLELNERFSKRDIEILGLIRAGLTNQEIARALFLTLATVKWYNNQIFGKLGVKNRTRAIQKATEFGLLKDQDTWLTKETSLPKHNLPTALDSFIGRDNEIIALRSLLATHCLVTLMGPGGVGKTRLALQVGAGLLDAFPNGVWLVELAPLTNPALVPQTVIAALEQVGQQGKSPLAFLADYLRSKQLLLILDNCEHLVKACAELAAALLYKAPRLKILVSSREILGVEGEMPFRVPPLGIPDLRRLPPVDGLGQYDAVRLFVDRARVVSPGFALTEENAAAVAQITQRLDGIPLAIELAAARLRLLSVGQIALRLDDAFHLLAGGRRTALPRHQTLQALIDWSYNLLSEEEQCLFRNLSVFAGSWTLEAAEAVGGRSSDTLDLLGKLADKSLILPEPAPGGEMRYRILETVRQYAHTRLVTAGEAEALRQRHLAYYLHLAESLEPQLRRREQIQILDYWEGEIGNLRLALEWALQKDVEAELRLAASLHWFWTLRVVDMEGTKWLEQGLEAEALSRGGLPLTGSRGMIRAKALSVLGGLLAIEMRPDLTIKANQFLAEALVIYHSNGPEHRRGLAWTLTWMGRCKVNEGDLVQAALLAKEALNLLRASSDPVGMAECLQILGDCEIDPEQQIKIYQEQLAIDEANEDIAGVATVHYHIGFASYLAGDNERACVAFATSGEEFGRVGTPYMVAMNGLYVAITSFLNGDLPRAVLCLEEPTASFREWVCEHEVGMCLFWKCLIAFAQGRYDQAAEFSDEKERIALKTGDSQNLNGVIYTRLRLARLRGDSEEAQRLARESQSAGLSRLVRLELGHLALQSGDLSRAGALWLEGLQQMVNSRNLYWLGLLLDGLAVQAMCEGKLERAARLFGMCLWRGWANTLSPIERAGRAANFAEIIAALGEERFAQLREEGHALNTMQVLAFAQEEG